MAETVTRQLREPFVEAAGLGITDEGLRLLKDKIDTSQFTGRQFVAPMAALETQAQTAAGSLQAGPDAYQDYMSPYQREVIDATTAALDREQQRGIASLRQRAQQAGAFGGGREAAFADFTRLGLVGPQLSSVIGGFPAATQIQTSAPPSTAQQVLGLGLGGVGLAGAVKGLVS